MSELATNASEYTVSEVSQALRRTVEDAFGHVRVRGEISGYRGQHSSGHAYFTLKDANACIDAVVWKGTFPRLGFRPEEGLEVIATGRLTTFARSSKYQIVIERLEPAGAGALMALLEERRKSLAAEGLFARERKRALPYLPRVIGVITSPTGAVIRDILHRLEDRFPSHVLVWPVRVQGETCAPEVVAALKGFNALPKDGPIARPDLIIVARGGGSIEDLWGFNEESVVRAVAESAIPVISAVGHETDTTLIDHVADMRAPTPTAAAEAAVPVRTELLGYVDDLGLRQRNAARRLAQSARDRFRAAAAALPRAQDLASFQRQRLDLASSKLLSSLRELVSDRTAGINLVASRLRPNLLAQRLTERGERVAQLSDRAMRGLRSEARALDQRLASISKSLPGAVQRNLLLHRQTFESRGGRLNARPVLREIDAAATRLASVAQRLESCASAQMAERLQTLISLEKLLSSLSYENVLMRGYAMVRDEAGELVSTVEMTRPGQSVGIQFGDGRVGATISGAPAAKRRARDSVDPEAQDSLF